MTGESRGRRGLTSICTASAGATGKHPLPEVERVVLEFLNVCCRHLVYLALFKISALSEDVASQQHLWSLVAAEIAEIRRVALKLHYKTRRGGEGDAFDFAPPDCKCNNNNGRSRYPHQAG